MSEFQNSPFGVRIKAEMAKIANSNICSAALHISLMMFAFDDS